MLYRLEQEAALCKSHVDLRSLLEARALPLSDWLPGWFDKSARSASISSVGMIADPPQVWAIRNAAHT